MTRISEALVYGIAWEALAAFLAPIVVALAVVLARVVGIRRALEIAAAVGAGLGALLMLRRSRQQGWADREARLERDTAAAIDTYRDIQNETARLPDADLDRANAPWVRGEARADRP